MTTERGFIALARGVLDHPIVGAEKPYTRHAAWEWLLFEASYKNRHYNAGGQVIELKRGQLAHSTRYMARAWGWPETNVRRFLERLKTGAGTGAMIGARNGAGITVLTICNYERHQNMGAESGALDGALDGAKTGAATAQQRRRKEQGNKGTKDIGPGASRSGEPEGFADWYMAYPKKKKRDDALKAFRQVVPSKVSLPELMTLTAAFAKSWAARPSADLKFCPYPASWLRSGEYRDVIETPGASAGGEFKIEAPQRLAKDFTEAEWMDRLLTRKNGQRWPVPYWGPEPGQPGCLVPAHLLVERVA